MLKVLNSSEILKCPFMESYPEAAFGGSLFQYRNTVTPVVPAHALESMVATGNYTSGCCSGVVLGSVLGSRSVDIGISNVSTVPRLSVFFVDLETGLFYKVKNTSLYLC